jgi:hypothetical protein
MINVEMIQLEQMQKRMLEHGYASGQIERPIWDENEFDNFAEVIDYNDTTDMDNLPF